MTRQLTLAIVFSVLMTNIAVHAASTAAAGDDLTRAVTAPKEDRELSFTVRDGGKVDEVLVKEGESVKKGQILIKLEAKEQEAIISQLRLELVNSDMSIDAATKTTELAKLEFEKNEELYEKGAGSKFEHLRSKIQYELEDIRLEGEKQKKAQVQFQLESNEARLDRYYLHAPIDGRIEMVTVSEGEAVQPLRPVVRLVDTNPLEVKADVDVKDALHRQLKKGDKAWIASTLPGFTKPMEGTVTFTASVADVGSETLRVTIDVPNGIGLKAGLTVTVAFDDPSQVASADQDK